LTASAQERPQGLVGGDGGAGGRQDQHRAREDRPPPHREGVSTIVPNCLPSASRACAANALRDGLRDVHLDHYL
jgi:hypothetical protein